MHFHPLQWASGFQTLYPYFVRGARSVLVDDEQFDPEALIDTFSAEGATGTFMPGPLLTPVLDAVEARESYEHSLKRMVVFFGTRELLERTTALLGPDLDSRLRVDRTGSRHHAAASRGRRRPSGAVGQRWPSRLAVPRGGHHE